MANFTTTEANRLLDLSVVDDSVYLALVTTVPSAAAAGTEVTGGGYARQPVSAVAAAGGVKTNDTQITFPVATDDYSATIVGYEVWDAAVGGNRRWFLTLPADAQRTVKQGDQYRIAVGALSFALS